MSVATLGNTPIHAHTLPLGLVQPTKEIHTISHGTARVMGMVGDFCSPFLERLGGNGQRWQLV